jgi:hypothetical protein
MQKEDHKEPEGSEGSKDASAWMNIGKMVFLVAVLVAAWFVLEWLMGRK